MNDPAVAIARQVIAAARTALSDPIVRATYEAASAPPKRQAKRSASGTDATQPKTKRGRPRKDPVNTFALAVCNIDPDLPAHKLPAALGLRTWSEDADRRRVERARQAIRERKEFLASIIDEKVEAFARKTGLSPLVAGLLRDEAGDWLPLDDALTRIDSLLSALDDGTTFG